MLRIPFLPTPYPDETLGSLLSRLHLHNGSGLWRCLLEESGYGRRTISQFHTIPVQDARLDKLLEHLGYSYHEMLHTLTELPFWLAFNNACMPNNRISIHENGKKPTRLYSLRRNGALSGASYCPSCLNDDLNLHGEPYIRRHHQLPVSLVCVTHGISLRVTCISCGITVLPFNRSLLSSPRMRCECGQDLRVATEPPPYQTNLQKLSQFAADTLSCTESPWTARQIRLVLARRMGVSPHRVGRHAVDLLHGTYGHFEESLSKVTLSLLRDTAEDLPLKLRASILNFRTPEFCALLSATGLTFEELKIEASEFEFTPKLSPSRPKIVLPITLSNAQMEFERYLEDNLSPPQAMQKLRVFSEPLFWLLRLFANNWLKQHGYECILRKIPSVNKDREKVKELIENNDCNFRTLNRSGPYIRASLRDKFWLNDTTREFSRNIKFNYINTEKIQRERADALSKAIDSILNSEDHPKRIHAGLLAKVVNLSMTQAQIIISKNSLLKEKITAANLDKNRRMAIWATRKVINSGKEVTATNVLLLAGLNTTRLNRKLAFDSIELLCKK